jgi:hypothetical protein
MIRFRGLIVALLSLTLVGIELIWTRIFSAEFFYSFAFLALSVAVLGLGMGALAVRLFSRLNRGSVVGWALALSALTGLIGPPLVMKMDPNFALMFSSLKAVGEFVVTVALLGSAFFFGGIALAIIFRKYSREIPRLYMADLLGAGAGVFLALVAMNTLSTPVATFVLVLPMILASLLAGKLVVRLTGLILMALCCYMAINAVDLLDPDRPQRAPVIYKHWDAMAKLKIYDYNGYYRGIEIDNVANSPVVPFDGNWEADTTDSDWDINVRTLVDRFDSCVFLSLGAGGGMDVLQALDHEAAEVYAVEVNPHINYMITYGDPSGYIDPPPDTHTVAENDTTPPPYVPNFRDSLGNIITCAEYTGYIYTDPRVHVISEDARTFVRRNRKKFDIVYSLSSNTWAALGSGAFALAENYLFTTEAFMDYWQSLSDSGFLSMEHQVYMPRLVSEVKDALFRLGVPSPERHFAIYNLPRMRRKLLLLSKQPLTDELRRTAYGELTPEKFGTIHLLYPPDSTTTDSMIANIVDQGWEAMADTARIDISPATDDRPFVAQLGLWKNLDWGNLDKVNRFAEFSGFPLSKMLISIILLIVILVVIPLNFVPYFVSREKLKGSALLYFMMIGMAFMAVEVVLIQKYALLIGASVYSIAAVLLSLLVGSGIGSRFSNRASTTVAFGGIVVMLLFNAFVFPLMVENLGQWGMFWRVLISIGLILPLGFFMGMPFPKGALRVGELVDWGFAFNGAASVIGAAGVVLVAVYWGFTTALLVATLLYMIASLLLSLRQGWK